METPAEIVADIRRDIQEMRAGTPNNANSVTTTFNLGGVGLAVGALLAVMLAAFAYGLHVRSEARELVMAAERRADMAEIATIRDQVRVANEDIKALRAYNVVFTRELNNLKVENGK